MSPQGLPAPSWRSNENGQCLSCHLILPGIAIQALVTRRFGHELGLAQIDNGDVFELWIEGDAVAVAPVRHALG